MNIVDFSIAFHCWMAGKQERSRAVLQLERSISNAIRNSKGSFDPTPTLLRELIIELG